MAAKTDGIMENRDGISREEVQAAIAKAVELRALHAVLMQGGNISNLSALRFPNAAALHVPQFSANDYPVFTPSYEEHAPCYQQLQLENNLAISDCWNDYVVGKKTVDGDDPIINSYLKAADTASVRKSVHSDDHKSTVDSTVTISPGHGHGHGHSHSQDFCKHTNKKNSCNECNLAIVSIETDNSVKRDMSSNSILPVTEIHQKNRGISFSWLRLTKKKKHKNHEVTSPSRMTTAESEKVSQIPKDTGTMSIEVLKKELSEAQEGRAAAMAEVSGMNSSMGELKLKLEYLETYCEELKRALNQATQSSNQPKLHSSPQGGGESQPVMPINDEAMVEEFLQTVSETRSSVKQFCKTLITQIDETDKNLTDNLNSLLKPYKLSLHSKHSKTFLYHLVAIVNQALFQDFENSVFQKNGCPKFLDPKENQHTQFKSFVALRNLSWNEVLKKGTKFYSEGFSKFCDDKMSGIIMGLSWTKPWSEQMLQSFFVAGKCVWLLHLLAFSFSPPQMGMAELRPWPCLDFMSITVFLRLKLSL